jgi:hypothetical protein
MKEHVLPEEPPKEFAVAARHLRYAGAWGFVVHRFVECMKRTKVATRPGVDGFHKENVRRWTWPAPLGGLFGGGPHRRGEKTPQLSGPIKDAFRSPFCIVYGTTGTEDEKREVKANAERFRKEWRAFAKGWAPIFADTEVTNEIMTEKNLILFGESETNSIIADFANSLPIKWNRNEATIAGRTYSMKRRGLAFVYPNPKHPQRAVVVFSGVPWGDHLPSNHKWDLMPDFILYTRAPDMVDRMEKTNEWVTAGFFGTDWSLERGRIFVKGVGEVDARGEPVAPAPEAGPAPAAEAIPEPPPGFQRVR